MTGLNPKEFKGQGMTVNSLADLTGLDRRTVKKYLEAEDTQEIGNTNNGGILFGFVDAIRAFINCSKGQNSSDRRNEAQARKAEVETAILERKYVLLAEATAPLVNVLQAINKEIQKSDLSNESKEILIDRIKERVEEITSDNN